MDRICVKVHTPSLCLCLNLHIYLSCISTFATTRRKHMPAVPHTTCGHIKCLSRLAGEWACIPMGTLLCQQKLTALAGCDVLYMH